MTEKYLYTMFCAVLIAVILILLYEWRAERSWRKSIQRTRQLEESRVRNIESLLCAGWTISTERLYGGELMYWELIAPDEKRSRILHEAVERQRKLNEIKKLNLPDMGL